MAWVERLVTRTTQPQDACGIDRSNPITPGSQVVVNYGVGSVNLATGGMPNVSIAQKDIRAGTFGLSQTANTAAKSDRFSFAPVNDYAVLVVFDCRASAGDRGLVDADGGSAGGGNGRQFQFRISGGNLQFIGFHSGDGNKSVSLPIPAGQEFGVAIAFCIGNQIRVAHNGKISNPAIMDAAHNSLTRLSLGASWQHGPSPQGNDRLFACALLDGRAALNAYKSLSDNPWQIFEPEVRLEWIDDAIPALRAPSGKFVERLVTRTTQPQDACELSDWARDSGFKTAILPGRVITGNSNAKWISSVGTPVTTANAKGKVSKYINNADVFYDGGADDPSTGYVVAFYGCFSAVGTWSGLFARNTDAGTTSGLAWQRDAANNGLRIEHGGNAAQAGSLNDLLDSTPRMWVFGWKDNLISLYRDGVLQRSLSYFNTPAFTPGTGRIRLASSRDVSASSAEISYTAFATGVGPTQELATSLFDNPWQIFEPEVQRVWIDDATTVAPPGDPTGTLAATETGSDTAVLSGQIVVQGTLAASDTGQDTAAFSGKVIVTGTLAAQETGSDTAALNGSASVTLTGTLAATEVGSDTATLTGKLLVQGALSAVETGSDTALINGSSVIVTSGALNATESGGDTAAMTGKLLVQALIDAAEQGADTASLAGQIVIKGTLAASEVGSDTAAIYSTEPVLVVAGALTRPSRLQSSGRPRNVQAGVRARR